MNHLSGVVRRFVEVSNLAMHHHILSRTLSRGPRLLSED